MTESRAVRFHQGDSSLKKNSKGEIVSKIKSKQEKKNPWILAVMAAKRELGIPKHELAFPKKGTALYELAIKKMSA